MYIFFYVSQCHLHCTVMLMLKKLLNKSTFKFHCRERIRQSMRKVKYHASRYLTLFSCTDWCVLARMRQKKKIENEMVRIEKQKYLATYGVRISLSSRWQKIKTTTITAPYSKEKQTTLSLQYVVISKNAYLKILIEIGFYDAAASEKR